MTRTEIDNIIKNGGTLNISTVEELSDVFSSLNASDKTSDVTVVLAEGHYHLNSVSFSLLNVHRNVTFVGSGKTGATCKTIIDSFQDFNPQIDAYFVDTNKFSLFDKQTYAPTYIREKWLNTFIYTLYYNPFNEDTEIAGGSYSKQYGNKSASEGLPIAEINVTSLSSDSAYNSNGILRFLDANDQILTEYYQDIKVGSILYVYVKWMVHKLLVTKIDQVNHKIYFWISDSTTVGKNLGGFTGLIRIVNSITPDSKECLPEFSVSCDSIQDTEIKNRFIYFDQINNPQDVSRYKCQTTGVTFANTNNTSSNYYEASSFHLVNLTNCEGIRFNNIGFMGNRTMDITRFCNPQSDYDVYHHEAGVLIANSCDIVFQGCEFSHIFGYCIDDKGFDNALTTKPTKTLSLKNTSGNVENVTFDLNFSTLNPEKAGLTIEDCYIHDTYGGGIATNGRTENNRIVNNLIKGYGKYLPGSVGILILKSRYNTIENNTICHGQYTAISIGDDLGVEATDPSAHEIVCYNNIVRFNKIYKCFQGLTNDGGGIYTSGIQPDTEISYNLIRDLRKIKYMQPVAGIYLESVSSGIEVKHNIIHNCAFGIFSEYAFYENVIRENVIAHCDKSAILFDSSATRFKNCLIKNNIFILGLDSNRNFRASRIPIVRNYMYDYINDVNSSGDSSDVEVEGEVVRYGIRPYSLYALDCSEWVPSRLEITNNLVYDSLNRSTNNLPVDTRFMNTFHYGNPVFNSINLTLLRPYVIQDVLLDFEIIDGFTIGSFETSMFRLDEYLKVIKDDAISGTHKAGVYDPNLIQLQENN